MSTTGDPQGPTFVKMVVDGEQMYCKHSTSGGSKELISRESCRKCGHYDGFTKEYISCNSPEYK